MEMLVRFGISWYLKCKNKRDIKSKVMLSLDVKVIKMIRYAENKIFEKLL